MSCVSQTVISHLLVHVAMETHTHTYWLTLFCFLADDPVLFQHQPVTLQIVGRPFEDEELLRTTEVLDEILNA